MVLIQKDRLARMAECNMRWILKHHLCYALLVLLYLIQNVATHTPGSKDYSTESRRVTPSHKNDLNNHIRHHNRHHSLSDALYGKPWASSAVTNKPQNLPLKQKSDSQQFKKYTANANPQRHQQTRIRTEIRSNQSNLFEPLIKETDGMLAQFPKYPGSHEPFSLTHLPDKFQSQIPPSSSTSQYYNSNRSSYGEVMHHNYRKLSRNDHRHHHDNSNITREAVNAIQPAIISLLTTTPGITTLRASTVTTSLPRIHFSSLTDASSHHLVKTASSAAGDEDDEADDYDYYYYDELNEEQQYQDLSLKTSTEATTTQASKLTAKKVTKLLGPYGNESNRNFNRYGRSDLAYVDPEFLKWAMQESRRPTTEENFLPRIGRRVSQKHLRLEDHSNYLDDEPATNSNIHDSNVAGKRIPLNNRGRSHGSLTEDKWRNYGTADALELSRRRHLSEVSIVSAHITRVHLEAMCKQPHPTIIQISEASKRYVPHCTVLHRCGDDTGCCHSDSQTCAPKRTTTVDLHFYVIPVGKREPIIEVLSFVNHTECHCMLRQRIRNGTVTNQSTTDTYAETAAFDTDGTNRTCQCTNHFDIFEETEEYNDSNDGTTSESRGSENVDVSARRGKICHCDCVEGNVTCERMKKGLEGLLAEDRLCIADSKCTLPTCEYGRFNRRSGRCPRLEEKLSTARELTLS